MTESAIIVGDCIEIMRRAPEKSIDAIVTDPPYGLGFMGKEWDSPGGLGNHPMRRTHGTNTVNTGVSRQGGRQRSTEDFAKRQARDARAFQAWCEEWAVECLRVLKPGGHLLAFGSPRVYHRLASAIEDAGFELRDSLMWLYGSGFPKSKNLDGDWEGWGTALKPAFEPVVVARKSLIGTVAANVAEFGAGALNIDGCRIEANDSQLAEKYASIKNAGPRRNEIYGTDERERSEGRLKPHEAGRWPSHVLFDETAAALLDAQVPPTASRKGRPRTSATSGEGWGMTATGAEYEDSGGPSRFFYCAKAPKKERNAGIDKNIHPTVKPVEVMRWLVRLVTPPGGRVLDPFVGSGTTGIACALEGFRFIGIERDPDYAEIAKARIAHWASEAA